MAVEGEAKGRQDFGCNKGAVHSIPSKDIDKFCNGMLNTSDESF